MDPRKSTASRIALATLALLSILGSTACDNDEDETNVLVSLTQFNISLDRISAPNGNVEFKVTNDGTVMHHFAVIRTDLAPGSLPTEADGSYEENGAGTMLVAEVDDIDPGVTRSLHVDLGEGAYVLICNMVGPAGSHYALGMRIGFTVD